MLSLYDLSQEGIEISEMLTEAMGELTPEIEKRIDAVLLNGPERIEAAAMVVKQLEAGAKACEDEADRLRERAKSFSDNASSLKKRMCFALDAAFHGKVKTPLFSIWNQTSADTTTADLAPGYTPEMLHQERPDLVRVKYEFDRQKAVAMYKAGDTEGMPDTLFFSENPGVRYVRIR